MIHCWTRTRSAESRIGWSWSLGAPAGSCGRRHRSGGSGRCPAILARHGGEGREDATAVMVAGLGQRIRRCALDRRPRRIAVNLLLDSLHDLTRRPALMSPDGHRAVSPVPELGWYPALVLGGAYRPDVLTESREVCWRLGPWSLTARKRRQRAEVRLTRWWALERKSGNSPKHPGRAS
jgi:hypothetical protein